jgi:hypothetical protein
MTAAPRELLHVAQISSLLEALTAACAPLCGQTSTVSGR